MIARVFHTVLIAAGPQLGDVLSTFPMAGVIKRYRPGCRVLLTSALYTKPLVDACEHIDGFLNYDEITAADSEVLQRADVDVLLNLQSDANIARAAKMSGVHLRVTNLRRKDGTRNSNVFVCYSRSNSQKHSIDLNMKMLNAIGIKNESLEEEWPAMFGLTGIIPFESSSIILDSERFNVVLHLKSGGHGREWPLERFLELVDWLPPDRFKIFLTGTATERSQVNRELPELLRHPNVNDVMGQLTLIEFLGFLQRVDGAVASGTGPLHIAAALGRYALGLFPPRRAMNQEKWRPVGLRARALTFDKNCSRTFYSCRRLADGPPCACMHAIPAYRVFIHLAAWLKLEEANIQARANTAHIRERLTNVFPTAPTLTSVARSAPSCPDLITSLAFNRG